MWGECGEWCVWGWGEGGVSVGMGGGRCECGEWCVCGGEERGVVCVGGGRRGECECGESVSWRVVCVWEWCV